MAWSELKCRVLDVKSYRQGHVDYGHMTIGKEKRVESCLDQ